MLTRRDFLNGAAITVAAGATLGPKDLLAMGNKKPANKLLSAGDYPPARTGLRGSHEGSYEVAHSLAWRGEKPAHYTPLQETYDLIIVGGGISGLSAAYLYQQQAGADKKILILDNHDDFGGHAKRNEFEAGGRTLLGVGGSVNLETVSFSDTAERVLGEVGLDIERLDAAREPGYLLSNLDAQAGYFLNQDTYGQNRIVHGDWADAWRGGPQCRPLVNALGLPVEQQERLIAVAEGKTDLLEDLSIMETKRYVESTPYEEFLREKAGLSNNTIQLFEPYHKIYMGLGTDSSSVAEAFLLGYPGMRSVGTLGKMGNYLFGVAKEYLRLPLFPDGNASITRMMVRKLIPSVAPGTSMEDVIDAPFDYSQLDQDGAPVRIRLNSTAVNVKNEDQAVEVAYVQNGEAYKVRAKNAILACYNGLIPHLCPEMPEEQKQNLKYGVKIPLVMTNVLLRSGASVNAAGPAQYHCPGSFYSVVTKAPPVNLGNYKQSGQGSEPLVLWMSHAPAPRRQEGQTARDIYRLGRHSLYRMPFEEYESGVKGQLTSMFGSNGLDADRDIAAITVNRWSHGYSYAYLDLYDPDWAEGQAPHELGRKPVGRISIANADSHASASLQAAIDSGARAVEEIS
ncbi:MAG: NAD(P)-binding protein [Myxococcota bacterium]|nr:NAD(P)-binding protein [Myxococcota bacterium]